MKYIIMCGGEYNQFKVPKQLAKRNGETLVERTIRLLRENKVEDIYISSNNPIFDNFGVQRIDHNNSYKVIDGKLYGYWLDAYYQMNEPCCYIYGDVYFTEEAMKTIVDYHGSDNTLFGSRMALNEAHENWGEPFAYKVFNNEKFNNGIKEVKKLQDEGKLKRMALTWELYRYLNNLDVNKQVITDNYVVIDDETIDIDEPEELEKFNNV